MTDSVLFGRSASSEDLPAREATAEAPCFWCYVCNAQSGSNPACVCSRKPASFFAPHLVPAKDAVLDLDSDEPLKSCPIPGNGDTCESCQ